jgi:hypothetical protein
LLLAVSVHSSSIQDREGAEALLRAARRNFPFIECLIGDATVVARRPAQKMDRRTHPRMDQPLSSARARDYERHAQGGRVRPPRHDPPHAAPSRPKPMIKNQNFAEGLLDFFTART